MAVETSSRGVVVKTHLESKEGSAVRVDRLELTKAGVSLLTATVKSIPDSSNFPSKRAPTEAHTETEKRRTGTNG